MKVISADMTLDRISVIVNAFIEMKNAEAILVDKDTATILASRDSAKISTTLGSDGSSAFEQSVAAKIADRDYSFSTLDGNMTVFEEVSGTNWILVSDQHCTGRPCEPQESDDSDQCDLHSDSVCSD